jgi:hypothetical protein
MSDTSLPLSATESHCITTAIGLLGSALQMRDLDDVRRNIVVARSTLFDVLASIDSTSAT